MNKLEWNDLRLILAIGRNGSLAGAARELQNDHSTIFRKLNGIEKRTGARFFERINGRYVITDAGAAAVKLAASIEDNVLGLERELVGRDTRLQGNIRMSAAEGPAVVLLPQLLAGFRRLHPEVTLELVAEFGASDLSRREADIALRFTRSPPDSNLGRYICDFALCAYAAPTYLKEAGTRSLEDHEWVVFQPAANWHFPAVVPSEEVLDAGTVLSTNSVLTALTAAREGIGAVVLPAFLAESDPDLVRIAGPFPELTMEVWVLIHPDLRNTVRIKVLMDYLARELRSKTALFEGRDQPA